ncbi:hypothetical protein B6D60_06640 [candidate division KSB1 bacterium 4484_87]|nr:MAG: hypothetical protein B6D60_06640 [candidate division KSB1 bacterium 4484_87]
MRAILINEPGHFEVISMDIPEPKSDEILVEIKALSLCNQHDWKVNKGLYRENSYLEYGIPGFPGHEGAGIVAAVGENVKNFEVGDHVALSGLGGPPLYAEYVTRKPDSVAVVNKQLPLEYVAMAELFGCVHRAVRKVDSYRGKRVLVSGCGPAGLAAIQFAKIFGAKEITATDVKLGRLALARELGADEITDAENEDQISWLKNKGVDIVIETSGNKTALVNGLQMAREAAVIFSYNEGTVQLPMWNLFDHEVTIYNSKWLTTEDLQHVVNYIEKGKLHTAPLISVVVDFSRYPEAVEMIGRGDAVKIIMVP